MKYFDINKGEIVYCNMTIKHKSKKYELKNIVYKNVGKKFTKKHYLKPLGINEDVEIIDIKILSRLGFENTTKDYTEVKKSNEKRNNITGAYE